MPASSRSEGRDNLRSLSSSRPSASARAGTHEHRPVFMGPRVARGRPQEECKAAGWCGPHAARVDRCPIRAPYCPLIEPQEVGMTTPEEVRYDVSDRIAEISLARPPVNALSLALLEQLIAALRRAAGDETVRAVVLTSALARRFSAGLDLR